MMNRVAIIIVNYKAYAEKYLPDCLRSLRRQEGAGDFKLYIVDNASSDKTLAYLKQYAPEADIIPRADGNYSAANSLGIERAMAAGCDYFVIANMDVVFDKNWLRELVRAVERDGNAGIAQSKIMLHKKNGPADIINSVGNIIHFLGFGFTKGYNEPDEGQYDGMQEMDGYASGSSFIIKREVVEKIGSYDGEYYMYHDDMEMSWRAKLAGYRIVFAPKSVAHHKYEFSRSIKMLYYMERNRYIVIFSFYKFLTIIFILPPLIAMDIGMLGYALVNGWFITKLKVYGYLLSPRCWRHIARVRRLVKSYRQVSDRYITRRIAGKVEYHEIMNPLLRYAVNPVFDVYWKFVRLFIVW